MNAFMVFSHYERQRVLSEHPEVQNTTLSKELGRRWNNLTPAQREPFVTEAERLKDLHNKEYPDYKYRPAKKRSRPAKQNQNPAQHNLVGVGTSWAGSMSRFSISQGQRGILKSINTNKLQHRVTINRKYLSKLSKQSVGFVALGGSNLSQRSIPIPSSTEVHYTHLRLTQSVPTSPEIPPPPPQDAQTVPSSSCPNTPLAPVGVRPPPSPYNWSDSTSLPDSTLPDHNSLPDLSQMFSASLDSDLRLDWTDEQLKDLNLNTADLDLGDRWLNNDIFSGIFWKSDTVGQNQR